MGQQFEATAMFLTDEDILNGALRTDAVDEAAVLQGLCSQVDPELFFPEKGGSTRAAKQVCLACDVRVECLDRAIARDERFGVWGGMTERERRVIKRSRQ